jgi:sugar phosphate isomerase/epimerase
MFKNLSAEALGVSCGQGELIELALSYGFKGIELDLVEFADQAKSQGMPKARRLLDSAKLKISSFRLPLDPEADDDVFRGQLQHLPNWATVAAEMGCRRALTWIEPASDLRPYHQNFEFHRTRFTEIARLLDPSGIRLGIGFRAAGDVRQGKAFEFIRGLDAMLMLLSVLGTRNVGVVLDLWDLYASGGTLDAMRKLPVDKIVAVQLADAASDAAAGGWASTARLLPGETGAIDAAGALGILAELGYDGPVTPVPHVSRLTGMRRDAIVKLAGEKLDQVWKAAGLNAAGKLAPSAAAATSRRA